MTTVHSSDELGTSHTLVSKAKPMVQRIIPPSTSQTVQLGQSIIFEVKEQDFQNMILVDAAVKYKVQNNGSATAFLIPTGGIWNLVEFLKLRIDGHLVLQIDQRMLKHYFVKDAAHAESVQTFLSERLGSCNVASLNNIGNQRSLANNTSSPFYCSSFTEVIGSLLANRHVRFFNTLQIEMQLFSPADEYSSSKQMGFTAGANLSLLRVTDLQLVLNYSVYPDNCPVVQSSISTVHVPYLQLAKYPITIGTGQVRVNLHQDFSPWSVISKMYFYITNSSNNGTYATASSAKVYVNNYITAVEVQNNGVRQLLLEGMELTKNQWSYNARNGVRQRDTVYNSSDLQLSCPSQFVSFERDFLGVNTKGTSTQLSKMTGVSNDLSNGSWVVLISYDTTGADAALTTMECIIESSRLIKFFGNKKAPEIST